MANHNELIIGLLLLILSKLSVDSIFSLIFAIIAIVYMLIAIFKREK